MRYLILILNIFVLATNVLANDLAGPYQVINSDFGNKGVSRAHKSPGVIANVNPNR